MSTQSSTAIIAPMCTSAYAEDVHQLLPNRAIQICLLVAAGVRKGNSPTWIEEMMSHVVDFVLGCAGGWQAASLIESLGHDYFQHAPRRWRGLLARWPRLSRPLLHAWQSHTMLHHGRTFRRDHVTQFTSDQEQQTLDEELCRSGLPHGLFRRERYGLTVSNRGMMKFLLPFVVLMLPLALCLPPGMGIPFAAMMFVSPFFSRYLHPYLHSPYRVALQRAPWPIRLILTSRYGVTVWRHHWIHHRRPSVNFNLMLFGGDVLRGLSRPPSHAELNMIRAEGGP